MKINNQRQTNKNKKKKKVEIRKTQTKKAPDLSKKLNKLIHSQPWEKEKVYVKKTKNRGYGLYAKKDLKKNSIICQYRGDVISEPIETINPTISNDNLYILRYDKHFVIDAEDMYSCYGRFSNDNIDPQLNNAQFVQSKRFNKLKEKVMYLKAISKIPKDSEITLSYGIHGYWTNPSQFQKLDSKSQKYIQKYMKKNPI